jgi:hypothetical protein
MISSSPVLDKMLQMIRYFEIPQAPPRWFLNLILLPFLVTRSIWELVAYFAVGNFLPNPSYGLYIKRGYFLTRIFPLDIFARWDSHWYFSILKNGYQVPSDLRSTYSNLAFFPLYPYLVKSVGWLGLQLPDGFYVLFGLVLSNLLFLASAALLYRLIIVSLGFEESSASRALAFLIVFPTSFFFSTFYPESLFLFLTLAGFTFALEEKWLAAGICAALVILTKPTGVIVLIALIWLYMERRHWRLQDIRPSVAWFLLAPAAMLGHFYYLYLKSGHLFAFFDAMSAWGGVQLGMFNNPLQNLSSPFLDVFKIDLIFTLLFILCGLYILWKWPVKALGIFALLMCVVPLSTGLLVSISRYLSVSFPVFIFLGEKLKRKQCSDLLLAVFFALQIIYFAGWVNYYWIA